MNQYEELDDDPGEMAERVLPDMPKKNLERANWAAKCLRLFGKLTGCNPDDEGWETTMSDFLADLRHLADREEVDTLTVWNRGLNHYNAEHYCCECGKELGADDEADDLDNACKKCLENLDEDKKGQADPQPGA